MGELVAATPDAANEELGLPEFLRGWAAHVYRHDQDDTGIRLGLAFVGQAEDPDSMFASTNVFVRGCVAVDYRDDEPEVTPEECPAAVEDLGLYTYSPLFPEVDLGWSTHDLPRDT